MKEPAIYIILGMDGQFIVRVPDPQLRSALEGRGAVLFMMGSPPVGIDDLSIWTDQSADIVTPNALIHSPVIGDSEQQWCKRAAAHIAMLNEPTRDAAITLKLEVQPL